MAPSLIHSSLHAVLDGTEAAKLDPTACAVEHYRGIKYGKISQRFAKAVAVYDWHGEKLDCSRFGYVFPIALSSLQFRAKIRTKAHICENIAHNAHRIMSTLAISYASQKY